MDNSSAGELKRRVEELELQLKVEQQRFEMLTDTSDYSLWEYDIANGRLIQSRKLDGQWSDKNYIVDDFRNQMKKWDLIYSEDMDKFDAYLDSMDRGDAHIVSEFRVLRDDARLAWLRYEGNTVYDEDGKPTRVIGKTIDITREKQDNDQLERRISRDTLTGLYTKTVAGSMINRKLADSLETGGALIIIDIDEFTYLQKTFGSLYGDNVLESVAGLIYTNFKARDIVGRIVRDEFLVYCSNVPDQDSVSKLISKLMLRFQEFIVTPEKKGITFSAGVAMYPKDGKSFEDLYTHADIALYQAKSNGKNQYHFYLDKDENDTNIGETFRKMQDKKKKEIISNKQITDINKELFDFAFDVISHEKDFYHALQIIFEEICLYFMIDRSSLMEYDRLRGKTKICARWVREEDEDDLKRLETTANNHWDIFEKQYIYQEYTVLKTGKSLRPSFAQDIMALNKIPQTALLFAIQNGNTLAGILVFEGWKEREWTKVEIATLSSITKMISSYLLQVQMKEELETEYQIGKKAMDVQKLIYYVVEEDTYQIRYMSNYAKETFPKAKIGQKCYEAMRNKTCICEDCPIQGCNDKRPQNVVEAYDSEQDTWNTLTATGMKNTQGIRQFLVCKANVTAFLERVKGEDQLTGVTSYEKFRMDAIKIIRKKELTYTLSFVGIRDFSRINDEYGYETGDQILKAYANLLKEDLVEDELLCRIKGDDFAVLTKKRTLEWMRMKLKSISDYLTSMFREKFPSISIHCFGGVYGIPENEEYISRCLDKAMKARKVALKNFYETAGIYVYSREFEIQEREKEKMNRKLKNSLKSDDFKVYFQPKVDIVTGEIIGAEALVRLIDQEEGMIYPGKFIPLAEESGLIVEIDRYVYEKTFQFMSEWMNKGKKVPLISVNLSRLHLLNENRSDSMKELSDKYHLQPNQIELEITESIFFEDTERLVEMVKQLKAMGYIISMDDFGAGFSTLSLMKTLPVDVVKIDGGFFLDNELDAKNKAVIAAIMQLSENLEFETVSEGVETKEQVDFIREQGGRCVQGYYFYKPMPAEEFEKLLKSSED